MAKGVWGSAPEGTAADCFYVLAMYAGRGGALTAAALHEDVARENTALDCPVPSRGQVTRALHGLARRVPPLVEQAPGGWRITGHGHGMLAAWCGEDDDEPCGVGWPGPAPLPGGCRDDPPARLR